MNLEHLRADYLISKYINLPNTSQVNSHLFESISFVFISILIFALAIYLIRKIVTFKYALTEPSILLELTPPAFSEKTAYTTQQLFSTLHDLSRQTAIRNRLQGRND